MQDIEFDITSIGYLPSSMISCQVIGIDQTHRGYNLVEFVIYDVHVFRACILSFSWEEKFGCPKRRMLTVLQNRDAMVRHRYLFTTH